MEKASQEDPLGKAIVHDIGQGRAGYLIFSLAEFWRHSDRLSKQYSLVHEVVDDVGQAEKDADGVNETQRRHLRRPRPYELMGVTAMVKGGNTTHTRSTQGRRPKHTEPLRTQHRALGGTAQSP